ncbi:MAG: Conserved TM helix repeat-containing protein [Candidatus Moranbacteria bacterium GW2011_GWC1_45_18]|nr:MAG: Conserved TM helix repeat-containing protein [Candidatus Moranbacteria bacterium GW2011_GWC2_40_12]KKT33913.1 MAG: Conserved TM helix repeat-containing protein [Candidatus Moranbacteria bacterium GW2011_GWF2_44_10]KKT99813.1 MAG: Conserved TM helix repeat-containing protein [Candidatus Moranbacteria bacterium GW2011_GWC1_45_18]OGI24718.1 MAG: hypothetical protein A2194_01695 [Candidatus Moranbacteria bacterium RIFOXYA1_FULL_44_8]OGI34991.1 MAG: hypothetical protein A2407_00520 [Candidat
MESVQTWGEAITLSLLNLWAKFVNFVPSLVGAILVFVAGWIVAAALGKVVEHIFKMIKVDDVMEKAGTKARFKKVGVELNVAKFMGGLVKWFLILVFLMAATDILRLTQVTNFLNSIILYLPNVVVAAVILAVAFLVANFVFAVVKGSTKVAGIVSATLLATVAKWAIVIFGFLAALIQLGIAASLINTLFIGFVAMLALAGGLAFGLGGKDEAALILKKIRQEITEKHD